jgi:hypothetical protein
MAIYIINEYGHADPRDITGADVHRGFGGNIMISILHRPEDGYKLSYDGEIIREKMTLDSFFARLNGIVHRYSGYHIMDEESKLMASKKRILSCIGTHTYGSLQRELDSIDAYYANLIRSGQAVLIQHTHSMKQQREMNMIHREADEKASAQLFQTPLTEAECYKSTLDQDIYYLMTP